MRKSQPAFGNGGSRGRRITELEEVLEEAMAKAYYDPEDQRQRALGMAQAGSGLAGGGAIAYGAHRVRADTAAHRKTLKGTTDAERKGVLRITKKPAAALLLGTGGLAAAHRIGRYADSDQNRRYN